MRFNLKNILLILLVASCASCAYKPRFLKENNQNFEPICCFTLASNIKNQQKIYHYIENGWEKYPNQKELRYYYNLKNYLTIFQTPINGNNHGKIKSIQTDYLSKSDTGLIAHGIKLIIEIENTNNLIQKYEVEIFRPFYSTLKATRNRIDKEVTTALNEAFTQLHNKIVN